MGIISKSQVESLLHDDTIKGMVELRNIFSPKYFTRKEFNTMIITELKKQAIKKDIIIYCQTCKMRKQCTHFNEFDDTGHYRCFNHKVIKMSLYNIGQ